MEVSAMATQIDTKQREVVFVEDAHIRPMMGNQVLESLPSRHIPYLLVDPYILIHEAEVKVDPAVPAQDTTHPHRGFDNMWYAISGSSSTGHSTGPGGAFERAPAGRGIASLHPNGPWCVSRGRTGR
jgi:redox-sensitive bicupin YhaK (pirin superfamily)